jgi:uncharacterized membrane protein YphA (DoxX/SURF4 family)
MVKSILQNKSVLIISRLVLGAIFVIASSDKLLNPLAFAQIIHNYRLMPPSLINLPAVMVPWIEFLAGLLLIAGYKARGANLVISCLLIFYIVLLTITAARGINVSCGCFSTSMAVKSNLLIRILEDIGMLILGAHILAFYRTKPQAA